MEKIGVCLEMRGLSWAGSCGRKVACRAGPPHKLTSRSEQRDRVWSSQKKKRDRVGFPQKKKRAEREIVLETNWEGKATNPNRINLFPGGAIGIGGVLA
uniref:Uncharacterized protein n=1 Tax=Aegilops tauschii subsp. strangulata TaxID=200361 RepID=A0A453A4L5_AEGTS